MASSVHAACGISGHEDAERAADQVCTAVEAGLGQPASLLLLCVSASHSGSVHTIVRRCSERLAPSTLVGAVGDGVLCGAIESDSGPSIAALAVSGMQAEAFAFEDPDGAAAALSPATPAIFFADTASIPSTAMVGSMHERSQPLLGGCVSAGHNTSDSGLLLLNGDVHQRGAVGVRLTDPSIEVSCLVSQGCRAVGSDFVITKASRNIIYQLGGRPALHVLRDLLEQQPPEVRRAARSGVLLGRVVNEYLPAFGRGDYLIREIARVLPEQDALALNDLVRVGQTVRFHVRDRTTAHEDLSMLLDVQKLHGPPLAAITLIGEDRGKRLFGAPNHDAHAISTAFGRSIPGPELAKPGKPIDTGLGALPMAGLKCRGEIACVGSTPALHTHSVCSLMLRATASPGTSAQA